MTNPTPTTTTAAAGQALAAAPALFDVTTVTKTTQDGVLERVAIEDLQLAPNPRTRICHENITTLAGLLMRTGQLIPCIGHRPSPNQPAVVLYDGQRRLLAAQASRELADSPGYEGLAAVRSLMVLLVDHAPTPDELRRIQAQANEREALTLPDQQQQFADCWQARTGLTDEDRVIAVCADLGISPKRAHNLRRQLTLPDTIRQRVAERPAGEQISISMASRLADMHQVAPRLTEAVAARITSTDLHDNATRDLGAFVHRTIVEDEHTYAVRIDDGAVLDATNEIQHARPHLTDADRGPLSQILGCKDQEVDKQLDALAAKAKGRSVKVTVTNEVRDRARAGRYAYIHQRGQDFADSIWVVSPLFIIDLCHQQINADTDQATPREEAYFAGANITDTELQAVGRDDRERRAAQRKLQAEAANRNIGLGHDLRAGIMEPTPSQLQALKTIICRLLAAHHSEIIAYGAGWTDEERQRPVGDTGRREPQQPNLICDAELQRALEDPDPLRAIAQITARWAAAFLIDPHGVTHTKTLGSDRMSRKLTDTLPGGENPLRSAVWEFMRPMLSPRLTDMHRDAFVFDQTIQSTVGLAEHRGDSDLADLDLDLDA